MANITISGISATATTLGATDVFEIEQGGTSKKIAGQTIQIDSSAGCWTVISGVTQLVAGRKYASDTGAGGFTVTLPLNPSSGDCVILADAKGTWSSNNLTVSRNSQLIAGSASDLTLNVDGRMVELVFVGGAVGWAVFNTGS